MPDPAQKPCAWVAFDLEACRIALEHWPKSTDRAGWLHGYHAGASSGVLWPRATTAEEAGFDAGQCALWEAQAKKKKVSDDQRARVQKRWTNRKPPEETPSNDP